MKLWLISFFMILTFGFSFSDNNNFGCSNGLNDQKENNDKAEIIDKQEKGGDFICDDQKLIIRDSIKLSKELLKTQKEKDSFCVYISDTLYYNAIIESFNIDVNRTISIRAKFPKYPLGYMIMAFSDGITSGMIKIPEEDISYIIKTNASNKMIYLEEFVDPDEIGIDSVLIPPENP